MRRQIWLRNLWVANITISRCNENGHATRIQLLPFVVRSVSHPNRVCQPVPQSY